MGHPPGYPLFLMLAKLFMDWLPTTALTQNPAASANVLGCICGTGAALFIFEAVYEWCDRNAGAGLVAGGAYAFSPLIWEWNVQVHPAPT